MKESIKRIITFLLMLCIFMSFFSYLTPAIADSGWDSGYSGGSSGGYSGGYSGGSYGGYNGNYDYDYGSSHSGGGSFFVYLILFLVIAVGMIIKGIYTSTSKIYGDVNDAVGSAYNDIPEEKLKEILPNYSVDELKQTLYNKYIDILEALVVLNEDKLKKLCDDEIYSLYLDQIKDLKSKQLINIKNGFENKRINLVGVKNNNDEIKVTLYIKLSYYDYFMDVKTKELVSGSKDRKNTETSIVDFVYVNNDFLLRNKRNVNIKK